MRNTKEIYIWMLRHDITVTSIQRALRFANHGTVSSTLAGRKNNRRVLQYLLDRGCPAEYLDLPRSMQEAA